MLYLSIDQHRKQLTVNLRNETGDVIVKRQVSTEWKRVHAFFMELGERSRPEGGFVTILEVCGFNDWLLKRLEEYGCRETILIQPEKQSKKKTDRRDANALGEVLWVNRHRLLAGKKVQGIRRVVLPSEQDARDRQLTAWRQRLGQSRTRTINRIKRLLRKHNLEQECPTKGIDTIKGKQWLAQVSLNQTDRREMDQLLAQWKLEGEDLVSEDQAASRSEDQPGGGDASAGDDHLAHDQVQRTLRDRRPAAEAASGPIGVRLNTKGSPHHALRQRIFGGMARCPRGKETASGEKFPPEVQRALGAPWLGYSSSGCVPAEPDSASPSTVIVGRKRSAGNLPGEEKKQGRISKTKSAERLHRPSSSRGEALADVWSVRVGQWTRPRCRAFC